MRGFTGQKENRYIGLTYMNARYYVSGIGRFASADTIVPDPTNPQTFNRYSYVLNSPLKYIDPTGHCNKITAISGNNEESLVRDNRDELCWRAFDRLSNFMENNPDHADAWGWDPEKYENDSFDSLVILQRFHRKAITEPVACRPGGPGNCSQAKAHQIVENVTKEMLPDAFITGGSGNAAGVLAGVVGGETVWNLKSDEVSIFTYQGQGGGVALKANATAYAGVVWNLEKNIDYEGDFITLTVDASFFEGVQINFFFSPNTIPFTGGTWGLSAGKSSGMGGGISGTATDFVCEFGC